MGRRAIDRKRKPLNKRAEKWVRELIPLLQDKNLDKLTLDELAELSGKSKSTIYTYFSTKEEIYHKVTELVLQDMTFAISPEAIAGDDMEKALREMLMNISKGIEGISIGYLDQVQQHFPEVWAVIEAFTSKILKSLAKIYEKGMEQGSFKRYNIALLTALDSHFVLNVMTDSDSFSQQGISLKELVQEYLELRINALR
jgi:AcrR family transcriptional regulator